MAFYWNPKWDPQLGTKPDIVFAKKYGVSETSIKNRRYSLGIPAFCPKVAFWTKKEENLVGTKTDKEVAEILGRGIKEVRAKRARMKLPLIPFLAPQLYVPCAVCGKSFRIRPSDLRRSKRHYCSVPCAHSGLKSRDSEKLQYGEGWGAVRTSIRVRDKVCRVCGKTPEANGSALHVHHLKPFRYGGMNSPENLVALCASCHKTIENLTDKHLDNIKLDIRLKRGKLRIVIEEKQVYPEK